MPCNILPMGSKLHGTFMSGVLFSSFHDSELTSGKNNGQYKCRGICNWSCVHDAIDSEANRENDDQWQQEEHLSCKGHDHTKPGFPMEVKKPADIGWIPLAKVISMKMRRYFSAK